MRMRCLQPFMHKHDIAGTLRALAKRLHLTVCKDLPEFAA